MDYTKANKAAWEQAFAHHQRARKGDAADQLLAPGFSFLDPCVLDELDKIQVRGKAVGQLCCNDGRELLSLVKLGAASGVGFDIAENFVGEARRLADKSGLAAQFVATDILDIPDTYDDAFDLLFVSIGALCWLAESR
jgi:SAM-dependent methyltransferase